MKKLAGNDALKTPGRYMYYWMGNPNMELIVERPGVGHFKGYSNTVTNVADMSTKCSDGVTPVHFYVRIGSAGSKLLLLGDKPR